MILFSSSSSVPCLLFSPLARVTLWRAPQSHTWKLTTEIYFQPINEMHDSSCYYLHKTLQKNISGTFQVCLVPPSLTPVWPNLIMASFEQSFQVEAFEEVVGLQLFVNSTFVKQVKQVKQVRGPFGSVQQLSSIIQG